MQFLSPTERGSPVRDFWEVVRKPHSHCVTFTTSTQKPAVAPAMYLLTPLYKSLRSFGGPNDYLKSSGAVRSASGARMDIMRSTCGVSVGYDLAIFQNLS